jgi:hypothetical protein
MSERDAVRPSFVTCVDSLTFTASVSSFFDLSNFDTLPVTSLPIELDESEPGELLPEEPVDAEEPVESDEPAAPPDFELPMVPVEPVEPPLRSLDALPLVPLSDVLPVPLSVAEPDLLDPV